MSSSRVYDKLSRHSFYMSTTRYGVIFERPLEHSPIVSIMMARDRIHPHTAPMLPTGTVTFLFTDIQGSTLLLQMLGEDYARVLSEHQALMREAFGKNHGAVVDTQGDSFFAVFRRALDGVNAAADAQRALLQHEWGNGIHVDVRMGLHTGEPALVGECYVGIDVHRAARIGSAGHGGQVLVSETTRALVKDDLPESITLRDLGEHRLKDLRHPKQLYQLLIAGLPCDFPPLRTLDTTPNNLPVQLTNFIGREQEIERLKRQLQSARLITLTGAGGSGKTRLSLQVAGELLEHFPDGVWLVELAPLAEPELVPQTIASVMGLREQAGENTQDTLVNYLRDKDLLLVLDNCEHLIDACAHITTSLLRACPHLKILASSREALGIAGEVPYRVPSLSLPPASSFDAPVSNLEQYEAVRLFIDRAVSLQPSFAVNNRNAPAVAQICARLDGIPLALELAAARIQVLSAEQIAKKLADRFRLLTGGSRTALPRQQTLRAAIDWSYELLTDPERILLQRLAVFAGGASLDAAEAVCSDDEERRHTNGGRLIREEILDLLTRLVDKSLVIAQEGSGETRFGMLETVRQYGHEKLVEAGEWEDVRDRHLEFFVQFARMADQKIKSAERPEWTHRVETENENLRAALEWSTERGGDFGLRLVGAMFRFWQLRGYFWEGSEWAKRIIAANPNRRDPLLADTMIAEGSLVLWKHDLARAHNLLEESVRLCEDIEYRRGLAEATQWLGVECIWHGERVRGCDLCVKSVSLFRGTGDIWGLALALGWLGWAYALDHSDEMALQCFEESRMLCLETGDRWSIGLPLHGMAQIAFREDDNASALHYARSSLALMQEAEDTVGASILMNTLGDILRAQGNYVQAEVYYKDSLALQPRAAELAIAWRQVRLDQVAQKQGIQTDTPGVLAQILATAEKFQEHELGWLCFVRFAEWARTNKQPERAAQFIGAATRLEQAIGPVEDPADRKEYNALMQMTRAALGERFDEWYERGFALTMDRAIALARQE